MADQSEEEGKLEPLVIFYDSEASNGNVYYGDVIEIAATCHPGVVVGSFERLINTKQNLGSFAINESGITEDLLKNKPFIDKVIVEFLDWINEMVVLAQKKNNTCYFPVLCAHGGYQFDFLILFANLERKGMPYSKFSESNIHFADSFLLCQQLQQDGNQCLQNTRLSIDGLFHNFFPKHTIKGRHRAMGDVKAMVKIFTQTPLKNVLHLMSVSTTVQRVKYFVSQSSAKEQQLILEEKMAALDSCSRNMSSKRLIREGLTYDLLKTVFQKCSSYMDFWQTLKKIGIERKVAKHFTSQFGAMGLENQGSLGYNLNTAMQNGSISNRSSQGSNGHSDRAVNGYSVSSNGDSKISVSSNTSVVQTSNSNKETSSCKGKDVIGAIHAERATSSSRAFEERPLDYAVTSSADERTKAYVLLKSVKQQDSKKDTSKNVKVASEVESRSCPETVTGVESTITDSLSSENTSISRDPSICNGDENWDSEIENSVRRGHFVLQFNEVIPSSIVQEDVCSSSGGSSAGQQRTVVKASHSKRAPTQPEAGQGKLNVGNKKESASYNKRSGDGIGSGVGRRHEHGHVKKSGESSVGFNNSSKYAQKQDTTSDLVHSNKTVKEIPETRDKSKAHAVSSEYRKQETLVSSAGTERLKQVTPGTQTKSKGAAVSSEDRKQGTLLPSAGTEGLKNTSAGDFPKVANGAVSKTLSSSAGEMRQKELTQKSVKSKRRGKSSSKKKPSSVTFLMPAEGVSADPTDLTEGDVSMTTVYVGDVPILVPVKKYSVPCEDGLDQPNCEDKKLETGNGSISTDGSTISRKEGGTPSNEFLRRPTTDPEEMVLPKKSEDDPSSVNPEVEDGQRQKMDEFEHVAKDLENTPPRKTSIPDKVPSTSVNESLSSSPYETSDTGSNLDYTRQTPPTFTEESKSEPGNAPSNHCTSGDNSDSQKSRDQAQASLTIGQDNNQPTAPTTEEHSSCDMDNASNIDLGSENVCEDNENQAANEQDGIPVDPSSEVDITPDVATQEQMNGYPEGQWPSSDVAYPNHNMYPVPPPQYPFQMPYPTAMPPAYGFYPALPHMMQMIPGPRPVHYPPMPFASQGMMPFGGFPPRFPMPMPMFPPPMYPSVQEGPPPNLVQEPVPQTSSSPDVLGIPDNRIQTSEHQTNKTSGISNVSFSTSSDDHSARSSPFPVDDSSGKTTPLTTPDRSPVDENFPGALSSSDKGEKGHYGHNRRKGYWKDTRPARYHTDERYRRTNRNGPWRGSSYRDNVSKKYLPDKELHADQGDDSGGKTRGNDTASEERKKTKASDRLSKEDKHSSKHARESSDQDKKLDSSSPKSSSKSPKSDQSTPPRRGKERDVKSKHGTSKLSPNNSKDVQPDHASPHASPTKSKSELLTPPRKVDKDYSPKTSRRDTRSEQSEHPKEERNTSSDPVATQQTSSTSSKSNQESSIRSAQKDSHKSVGSNKRVSGTPVESQESSRTSNLHATPNKASSRARTHPSNSTSSDGTPQVDSVSSKDTTTQSLSDLPATASSMPDKKNDKLVPSEKEPKAQDQKDEAKAIPPRSLRKEAKHQQNESRNTENKNVKWPQSALASQKFKESPKPQRDPRTRRVRESHSSDREKRVELNRQSVGSQRNEDVKEQPKDTDPVPDEKKNKDSITASEKVQSKEPFSASGKDIKAKSGDKTWKNSTVHSDLKMGVNYRDVLLGKQSAKANGDEKTSPRTNGTVSSDVVKEGSSGAMEPKPHPQAATTDPPKESHVKNQPMSESGPMKNPRGTPHPRDQAKTVRKEYRSEREVSLTKQPYKDGRGVNTARGSTMSRDPAPWTNTRNPPRNRHYDTNNNNNFQSRNTAYKSTKS